MGAYVDHAAYYVGDMDWYLEFFRKTFDMDVEKQRTGSDGLREVWLQGGVQLCETRQAQTQDGRAAHLCLIVDDLEAARDTALALGCAPMDKHHWVKLPDGLCIELFPAAPGAVAALAGIQKRRG